MPPNPNDALTKPHATTLSMWKLYDLMERGLIDLDAEYQRDVVWAHNKMSHLIDSILKNYYVPPVLFAIKQNAEGRNVRVCVDGKQRLTSIKKFMDNEIPHINPGDPKIVRRYYDYDEKHANHKILSDREREDFEYSEVVCIEYSGLTEAQEQEIFSRVQLGVALTTAEKLQAFSTPMANFCRKVLDEFKDLSDILDSRRSRPFHIMAQCLHITFYSPTKFGQSYTNIQKFLKIPGPEITNEFRTKIRRIMNTYVTLIKRNLDVFVKHPTKPEPTKFAPMEFLMFAYLIGKHPERTITQLEQDCRDMRADVRATFKDIRTNSSCFVHMKNWIDTRFGGGQPERVANGKRVAPPTEDGDEDDEWYVGQDEEEEEEEEEERPKANTTAPVETPSGRSQYKKPKIEPQQDLTPVTPAAGPSTPAIPTSAASSAVKPPRGRPRKRSVTASPGGNPATPVPSTDSARPIAPASSPSGGSFGKFKQTQRKTTGGRAEKRSLEARDSQVAQTEMQCDWVVTAGAQTGVPTPPPSQQQQQQQGFGGNGVGQQRSGEYNTTEALLKGYDVNGI